MTYYGRWTYKYEEAARQGAKGCLIIHSTVAASYPFSVQQANHNTSRLQLDSRGKDRRLATLLADIFCCYQSVNHSCRMDSTLIAKADARGFKALPLNLNYQQQWLWRRVIIIQKRHCKSYRTKYPDETIITRHIGTISELISQMNKAIPSIWCLRQRYWNCRLFEIARAFTNLSQSPERTLYYWL